MEIKLILEVHNVVMFNERIKQLQENFQIQQRKLAVDIDTALYCKIERGERRVRKEHIPIITELLEADKDELLTFCLADQDEQKVADKALYIAKKNMKI